MISTAWLQGSLRIIYKYFFTRFTQGHKEFSTNILFFLNNKLSYSSMARLFIDCFSTNILFLLNNKLSYSFIVRLLIEAVKITKTRPGDDIKKPVVMLKRCVTMSNAQFFKSRIKFVIFHG